MADALSRLPIDNDFKFSISVECIKLVESLDFSDISFHAIRDLTKRDPVLSQFMSCLRFGCSVEIKPLLADYASVKSELSLYDGVILY